ncbi:hypothetical protein GGR62_003785 [Xanthomonas campestris]|nr:hypothetical protein [Xanthomonas sp. 3075]
MHLDEKQRGVALGMASGLIASLLVVFLASRAFLGWDAVDRIAISLLLPATAMCVAIARMAKHRFFTPADIDGSALSVGTDRARTLESLLQNTTEQLALALPVYVAALLSTRPSIQAAAPACACAFLLGRLTFFASYSGGARARALGFALTFYPTVLLLIWQVMLLLSTVAN